MVQKQVLRSEGQERGKISEAESFLVLGRPTEGHNLAFSRNVSHLSVLEWKELGN